MPLESGQKLGPYEIVAPIGSGGMGEVYRAHDVRLGRDVALKILPSGVAADPAARSRFETAARAVAALSHPNILALHDIGNETGNAYVVTELLEGSTLRDRTASARSRCARLWSSRSRSRRRSPPRTRRASCTAISSPRTCSSPATAT